MGKLIKEKREILKINRTKLGELLGLSCKTISAYELGTRLPSIKSMIIISKVLSIPIDKLLKCYK